ncbi:unnamed protein product, partial [Didymodactylos carnosus]
AFGEPFQVPKNCTTETGDNTFTCFVTAYIDYIQKQIEIQLNAENESPASNETYGQEIMLRFDQSDELMKTGVIYGCTISNDCAKNYIEKQLRILVDHEGILHTIKDKLYNPGSSNVQQCNDLQNNTIACGNGQCRAELGTFNNPEDPVPFYRTYCNYSPPEDPFQNKTGLFDITARGYPPPGVDMHDLYYVCNQNLCNNQETINLIQKLINDYNLNEV